MKRRQFLLQAAAAGALPMLPAGADELHTATVGYAGRMEYRLKVRGPVTFRAAFSLARPATEVRVIFGHASLREAQIASFSVAAGSSLDQINAEQTWSPGTFDGGVENGFLPPAAGARRRKLTKSDWTPVPGGEASMIFVSAFCPDARGLTLIGAKSGSPAIANWPAHPERPRLYQHADGNHLLGVLPAAEARATSMIVGLEYRSRHAVRTCLVFGDSIDNAEGRDVQFPGADAAFVASLALNDAGGTAWEVLNLAWSGVASGLVAHHVGDALADQLQGDLAIVPIGSPNDAGKGFRNDTADLEAVHAQVVADLEATGIQVLSRTWAPTDRSVKKFGHGDEVRRQYNASWINRRPNNIFDADAVLAGDTVRGQVEFVAGFTSDGIHPNDVGIASLARALQPQLLAHG